MYTYRCKECIGSNYIYIDGVTKTCPMCNGNGIFYSRFVVNDNRFFY